MYFLVKWIKQLFDISENFNLIIQSDSINLVRESLESAWIVIISLEEYEKNVSDFWEFYFGVNIGENQFNVISDVASIEEACILLLDLWFDLKYANSNKKNITEQESNLLIQKVKDSVLSEYQKKKKNLEEEAVIEKETFESKELIKIKEIVPDVINYIHEIINQAQESVSRYKIHKLQELESNLRRVVMGKNKQKLQEILKSIFDNIEDIQNEYFSQIASDKKIFEWTKISESDISRENMVYKNAQFIKTLWLRPSSKESFYIFFEKIWFFIKFLQKDFISNSNFVQIIFGLFDKLEYFLIVIIVEFWIFFWLDHFWIFYDKKINLYLLLIHLWVIWSVLFIIKKFRKNKIWKLLFLLWLTIAMSYSILNFIMLNFSLF